LASAVKFDGPASITKAVMGHYALLILWAEYTGSSSLFPITRASFV